MSADSPELLDAFKAAALSVTKLYKTSATAQAKSRSDGYQDCLEDLLVYLDKEGLGSTHGEGWKIRKWVNERMEGRETSSPALESEDEAEKSDGLEIQTSGTNLPSSAATIGNEPPIGSGATPATTTATATFPASPTTNHSSDFVVPTQDNFTFQSQLAYPYEAHLNLANLDLSDSRGQEPSPRSATTTPNLRPTIRRNGSRASSRTPLGRVAGQKRKVNLAEIFDLGSLGYGKDMFGGGKRGRFT